ncbi:MAG: hypothetical protein U0Q20_12790 [Mycobacterium sp.]|nr:hypothetical protein [Mycobacterium sp.]
MRRLGAILLGVMLAAVGLAAPASAILPPVDGYYTFHQDGLPDAKWQMQSICIQANGTRAQPDYTDETIQTLGCDVLLGSSTQPPLTRETKLVNFSARAKLTGGLWTFQIGQSQGVACPDGSFAPSTDTFSFTAPDPNGPPNLTGTHTSIHDAVCGLQAAMTKAPFTLTFTDVLDPSVVARFPALCNYLVGRPSICA